MKKSPKVEWPPAVAPIRPLLIGHLERLEIWAIFCLLGGLALPLVWQNPLMLSFGLMTAAWAFVNLIIAVLGKNGKPPSSVQTFVGLLVVNQIANYLYILVGSGVALFGGDAPTRAGAWAVVVQGFALMLLDAYLLKKCRGILKGTDV
jgi:hypothetical protein